MTTPLFTDSDLIHSYTRAEAIADGVLIDVTDTAKEAGLRYPVAVTAAVWARYVTVPPKVECQDEVGRLWDIVNMLRYALSRPGDKTTTILYRLYVRNTNRRPKLVTLKAVCGPADDGSPCLTITMVDED